MAEAGDQSAQLYPGWMYKNGHVVDKDYSTAVEWCRKSAEQGHSIAQNNLGHMYQNGYGVDKDERIGTEWYKAIP